MKGKKILAATLATLMTTSSVGITAFADDNSTVNTEQKQNTIIETNDIVVEETPVKENDIQLVGATNALDNLEVSNFGAENNFIKPNTNGESYHAEVMLLTLGNVNTTVESASVKLYHDDELLSTTTGLQKVLGAYREGLSFTIITNGDAEASGSWQTVMNQTDWYDKKPNKIVVTINDEEKTFENVVIRDGVEKYEKMEVALKKVAEVDGVGYSSLQKAVDAAQNNDTITLISDITVKLPQENIDANSRYYYTVINNKTLTIDFNGRTIKWDETQNTVTNVLFAIYNGANITVTGNGNIIGPSQCNTYEFWLRSEVPSLNYQPSKLTIESCNIKSNGGLYTNDSSGNDGGEIIVNGGRFEYTSETGNEWVYKQLFNVNDNHMKDNKRITINGGTFVNIDPNYLQDNYGTVVSGIQDSLMIDSSKYSVTKKDVNGKKEFTVVPNNSITAVVETDLTDELKTYIGMDMWGTLSNKKIVYAYETLAETYANANAGDTITLTKDTKGNGIVIDKDITIDLKNHTYDIDGTTVGSAGTETNGFQILRDNNVTIKNGTIKSDKAQILIQNYANLTIEDATLDGTNLYGSNPYTLSHNNGVLKIDETSTIIGSKSGYAFDVAEFSPYSGASVQLADNATVNGFIQLKDYYSGEHTYGGSLTLGDTTYTEQSDYIKVGNKLFATSQNRSINVYADKDDVKAGETVTVSVKLNGSDLTNAQYALDYDTSKFELITAGNLANGVDALDYSAVDGKITDKVYRTDGKKFADGDVIRTYTFKAIAQTTEVIADFAISDTKAMTNTDSGYGLDVPASNNDKASVKISLMEIDDVTVFVDNTTTTSDSKEFKYDGSSHTFAVSTTHGVVSYKFYFNGNEVQNPDFSKIGTYTIKYNIAPETGYKAPEEATFTITISDPNYLVEVNLENADGADYVKGNSDLNTKAQKIILVYTDVDGLFFTYNNKPMIDVTASGYTYNNGETSHRHVYAFVSDSITNGTQDDYESLVDYRVSNTGNVKLEEYNSDLNINQKLEIGDVSFVYGVFNALDDYLKVLDFQTGILKADTDKNKVVNADDTAKVVTDVKNALNSSAK